MPVNPSDLVGLYAERVISLGSTEIGPIDLEIVATVPEAGGPRRILCSKSDGDYRRCATPGVKATPDGWMNRLVRALPGESAPTRALGIGPVLPRILAGRAHLRVPECACPGMLGERSRRPCRSSSAPFRRNQTYDSWFAQCLSLV